MIRLSLIRPFLILTSVVLPLTAAQTLTVADPNIPGGSIVEVVSTNLVNGLPITVTASSIPAAGAATTNPLVPPVATTPTPLVPQATTLATSSSKVATIAPTTPTLNPGPVAQPAPTTVPVGQGVTQYTYTTVNALGVTTVLSDLFTPTFNTPSPPSSPVVGTVLGMSAWSALIGTNTAGGPTNGADRWQLTRYGAGGLLVLACGIAAGALTVL